MKRSRKARPDDRKSISVKAVDHRRLRLMSARSGLDIWEIVRLALDCLTPDGKPKR